MKSKVITVIGMVMNLVVLAVCWITWTWYNTPEQFHLHPMQRYFHPVFVTLTTLWMIWALFLLYQLVQKYFLRKGQFIFATICYFIDLSLFILISADFVNHFVKPAFFTGWIPYFGNQLSKDLMMFWTSSHLNYLLLFCLFVFTKKAIDQFVDRKNKIISKTWLVGWVTVLLACCSWGYWLTVKMNFTLDNVDNPPSNWNPISWIKVLMGIIAVENPKTPWNILANWFQNTKIWPFYVQPLYFAKILILWWLALLIHILLLKQDKLVKKLSESSAGAAPTSSTPT